MGNDREYGMPEKNVKIDDIINSYDALGNDSTLESILAEFKGEAFIDGDKRTPSDILQKKTDEIIVQETGRMPEVKTIRPAEPQTAQKAAEPDNVKPATQNGTAAQGKSGWATKPRDEMDDVEKWFEDFVSSKRTLTVEKAEPVGETHKEDRGGEVQTEARVEVGTVTPGAGWNSMDFTDPTAVDKFAKALSAHMEKEAIVDEPYEQPFDTGHGRRVISDDNDYADVDLRNESSRFAGPVKNLSFRLIGAAVIAAVMTVLVYLFYAGTALPFGIGTNQFILSGVLLIMQLAVMALGIEVFISGITDAVRGEPGAESLLTVSALMTVIDSFIIFIKQDVSFGLPFCLITAWAVVFAVWGRKSYYVAMHDSLKTSFAAASPYGVINEDDVEGRKILKKISGNTNGFYLNLIQADTSENVYAIAAPLLMILSFVLAFLASVGHGAPQNFCHNLTVMLAVSAAFSSTNAFALPFRYVSRRMRHEGCAIAGWGGACNIADADSAIITDEDIFPVGTVTLSGAKLFGRISQQKAIVYTASLIIASKSGLTNAFVALLKDQGYQPVRIKDFACYEGGGVGALIDGERVLVGSGAFMNLMGIRVAENIKLNNSVFLAVNDELSAVFSANYVPVNSVQSALVSVLNTQIDVMLAVRDFNICPNMIQHKFKVSMEGVRLIPAEMSYRISEEKVSEDTVTSAVLCREGLGPFAEVISGGRLLKKITDVNTVISVASGVVGLLLMFFLCWNSAFESASVKNVFLLMMIIQVCVVMLSKVVKHRN